MKQARPPWARLTFSRFLVSDRHGFRFERRHVGVPIGFICACRSARICRDGVAMLMDFLAARPGAYPDLTALALADAGA
ncbi:hypothetical protein DF156_14455 [Burkholderia ubonensis]|uniref:Uncharacterized protein n=2 Tax=Burkholderia ubonensis TaxID=101571 RepID=A0AB74DHT4_9BURK|nr:hypothetical protein CJO71_21680 [Burkholderia ubonensis]PAJ89983.1 hypothetical protein CJO70_01100 [Burkholderia ubonensis]PAJ96387.1 hypothetical protein CJO69_01475 [Burkholderia ubonensis]PAK02881.1 hypothetical protein CJO68_01100 [Burkholderia ubonensis]PAK07520.1 hypothetical protein CJO67_12615 [Burkholderia ubonensis]